MFNYLLFIGTLIISYSVTQGIYYNKNPDIVKKDWKQNLQDIFILIVFCTLPFIIGKYNTLVNPIMLMVMLITSIVWVFINGVSLNNLSIHDTKNVILYIIGAVCIVIFIIFHIKSAKKLKILKNYGSVLIFVMLIVVGIYTTSYINQDVENVGIFHLHHWMIGWIFTFFTIFNNPISNVAAGVSFGLIINGFAMYSKSLNIYYENPIPDPTPDRNLDELDDFTVSYCDDIIKSKLGIPLNLMEYYYWYVYDKLGIDRRLMESYNWYMYTVMGIVILSVAIYNINNSCRKVKPRIKGNPFKYL